MTTAAFPLDELSAVARQARPGRAILTAVLSLFVFLGWLAGTEVSGFAFLAITVRYGYRLGRGLDPVPQPEQGQPPPAYGSKL